MISCLRLDEIANCTNKEIIKFLTRKKIKSLVTFLQNMTSKQISTFFFTTIIYLATKKKDDGHKMINLWNDLTILPSIITFYVIFLQWFIVTNNEIWFAHRFLWAHFCSKILYNLSLKFLRICFQHCYWHLFGNYLLVSGFLKAINLINAYTLNFFLSEIN